MRRPQAISQSSWVGLLEVLADVSKQPLESSEPLELLEDFRPIALGSHWVVLARVSSRAAPPFRAE